MPIYWEQSVGGIQEANSDIEEDDEDVKYRNHR
jgi:hypothetical protein